MTKNEKGGKKNTKRIIMWLLVVLVMAGIYFMSAQTAPESNALSGKTIRTILLIFMQDFPALTLADQTVIIASMQSVIRDAAHVLVYSLLGALCMLALLTYDCKMKTRMLTTLIFGIGYAFIDELHQYFVSGRAFEFYDILLDGCGLLLGIIMVSIVYRLIYHAGKRFKYT